MTKNYVKRIADMDIMKKIEDGVARLAKWDDTNFAEKIHPECAEEEDVAAFMQTFHSEE